MKNCYSVILCLLLLNYQSIGQSKSFARSVDSNLSCVPNKYLSGSNYSVLNKEIDPFDIDEDALSLAIIIALNATRKKIRKPAVKYDSTLDILAQYHTTKLKHHRFKNTAHNQRKMNRYLYWMSRKTGVTQGIVGAVVSTGYLMKYKYGEKYFYHEKDETTVLHLFKGSRSQLKDSTAVLEPVETITYKDFGEGIVKNLMRSRTSKKLRAAIFKDIAIRVQPIQKTIHKKKIPQAKLIILLAGRRMEYIEPEK